MFLPFSSARRQCCLREFLELDIQVLIGDATYDKLARFLIWYIAIDMTCIYLLLPQPRR